MIWLLFGCVSLSVVSDSALHGLQPTKLLCPWNLQARILEWVAMPFSRGLPDLGSPTFQADSFPVELPRKPQVFPMCHSSFSPECLPTYNGGTSFR